MANWRYKIELNKAIATVSETFDLTREEEEIPPEAANIIANEMRKAPPLISTADLIIKAKTIAEANRIIDRAYDIADKHLVWCGFF